jgi:excisionase family DNA binding protein
MYDIRAGDQGGHNEFLEVELNVECLTVSVQEAGRALGCSRNTAYEAVHRGEIPVIRIGKLLRVPKAALERLLSGAAGRSTSEAPGALR